MRSGQFTIRESPEVISALNALAQSRGTDRSSLVRAAYRRELLEVIKANEKETPQK